MGFIQAAKNYYTKCIDFRSRAPRSEYWWGILEFFLLSFIMNISIIVIFVIYMVSATSVSVSDLGDQSTLIDALNAEEEVSSVEIISLFTILVLLVISIFSFIFLFLAPLSLTARRLHDVNRSGWWQLIFVIPLLGLILWLYWMLKKGDEGENRFGPDPLAKPETHIQNTET